MKEKAPSDNSVAAELGPAKKVWDRIVAGLVETYGTIDQEWKPSRGDFGWMCLLRHKKRTLLYLTPEKKAILVAIVLGERAVALALASEIPESIKALIQEARPYAEGRGIRFPIKTAKDVSIVNHLVAIKTTPK